MKKIIALIIFSSLLISPFASSKSCKKGQPCGNSCISWKYTCHKNKTTSSKYKGKTVKSSETTLNYYVEPYFPSDSVIEFRYVTANALNIRKGPGTLYSVIGVYKKGEKVKIKRSYGFKGWQPVRYMDKYYWVSAKYLSMLPLEN